MAVGAKDDKVFDGAAVDLDRPVDEIVDPNHAGRDLEPNGPGPSIALARGYLVGGEPETGAVVDPRAGVCRGAAGALADRLALRLELVWRAIAIVGAAEGDQPSGRCTMAIDALGLKVG